MKPPVDQMSAPSSLPADQVWGEDEFAPGADEWAELGDGVSRRAFLQRMAASMALAGVAGTVGCSQRPRGEKLVPYVNPTANVTPGNPLTFATAMTLGGYARGVLATSREGRPIKVDGNPDHPSSLGGSDVFLQASILDLYEPGRVQVPSLGVNAVDWNAFFARLQPHLDASKASGGKSIRFLSGPITSPVMADQIAALAKKYANVRWHYDTPLARKNGAAGSTAVFGKPYNAIYNFDGAQTVVALDSDFLFDDPGSLRYARQFFNRRRVRKDNLSMNRLYAIESTFSITGSVADHRLPVRPGDVASLAAALAAAVGVAGVTSPAIGKYSTFVQAIADELVNSAKGASIIVAGESQPPAVHALAYAMNVALGNVGKTVTFIASPELNAGDEKATLKALTDDLNAGNVGVLLILGENPVFTAPTDIAFADALKKFSIARHMDGKLENLSAHLSTVSNETTYLCQWSLPMSHYLEAWGDARGHDGTASIIQPLINPLYVSKSALELVAAMAGSDSNAYEIMRTFWAGKTKPSIDSGRFKGDFEAWWAFTLQKGIVEGSASAAVALPAIKPLNLPAMQMSTSEFDLVIRPDYSVWDGTFARNSWLQEMPRPLTKLVWDNALYLHPATAEGLGMKQDDVAKVTLHGKSFEAPVDILPGLPKGAATIHLGYGFGVLPPTSDDIAPLILNGVNIYPVLASNTGLFVSGVQIEKTAKTYKLVHTRSHNAMGQTTVKPAIDDTTLAHNAILTPEIPEDERETNNRKLVRVVTIDNLKADPDVVKGMAGEKQPLLQLYNGGWDYTKGYQWGMSIDQTACMGCNACAIACQAENNIAIVGKEQVDKQREMHWIRIDDYFGGGIDDPFVAHQPVPCMHCENAPCEYVCPVGATSHSSEGLNQMTYNRCVGTRYCSNNCSYKVRRFNFLDYTPPFDPETRHMLSNPEVTVRVRGVMEKCSYCVQRLQNTRVAVEVMQVQQEEKAKNAATEDEKQSILDKKNDDEFKMVEGLQTACQQACPSQAISFGSIIPVAGKVTQIQALKYEPNDYVLLRELTTKPRTSYMAKVRNPNPALSMEKSV